MNIEKIKYIKLSLMKKKSEINKDNKSDYEIYSSAMFNITPELYDERLFSLLPDEIYKDLISKNNIDNKDYLGIWINYNDEIYENAVSLQTIDDMIRYGDKDINPIYEIFKMTLNLND